MPTDEQLADAWVTLGELYPSCIDGTIRSRDFDSPSAVRGARAAIEIAMKDRVPDAQAFLFAAQDSRSASLQD